MSATEALLDGGHTGWWRRWYPWVAGITVMALTAAFTAVAGQPGIARGVLVVTSTGIGASSAVPSIAAMRRDPRQLSPVTWAVWAVMAGVAAWAAASTHDWPAAIFAVVGVATCTTIVAIALRHGTRHIGILDVACLLLALAGIALWQSLDQPGLAVLAVCVADFIGLVPTLRHAWQQPDEEPASTFILVGLAAATTAIAAFGQWTVTALAYPLYVAASTGTVALLASRTRPNPPSGVPEQATTSDSETVAVPGCETAPVSADTTTTA